VIKLNNLLENFQARWPAESAEEWDRPGLMIGHPDALVSKVLLCVDITVETVQEAIETGCQLLLAHHPMLLRGVTAVPENTAKGNLIAQSNRANLAIFAAHTNADFTASGVSMSLARALGLSDLVPLEPSGQGVIGKVEEVSLIQFAKHVAKLLPSVDAGVKVAGDPHKIVSTVGLLAGAGDSLLDAALAARVDVYVTSDLRHHPASDFLEQSRLQNNPGLIDISHWAAEWIWLDVAAAELADAFPAVEFVVSEINTDPWDFAVMQ
jgi:dinuclear metal center YbgI/SA1388 family protein